eukprot:5589-Heterococcus_DN1.PRE.1
MHAPLHCSKAAYYYYTALNRWHALCTQEIACLQRSGACVHTGTARTTMQAQSGALCKLLLLLYIDTSVSAAKHMHNARHYIRCTPVSSWQSQAQERVRQADLSSLSGAHAPLCKSPPANQCSQAQTEYVCVVTTPHKTYCKHVYYKCTVCYCVHTQRRACTAGERLSGIKAVPIKALLKRVRTPQH